ncbi:MAG: hypothetical protein JHC95_19300, partial [Solirubrobacteraceae bacterium]|nr:hypothetical protein [Solirubrobacteraceae bacterium]
MVEERVTELEWQVAELTARVRRLDGAAAPVAPAPAPPQAPARTVSQPKPVIPVST